MKRGVLQEITASSLFNDSSQHKKHLRSSTFDTYKENDSSQHLRSAQQSSGYDTLHKMSSDQNLLEQLISTAQNGVEKNHTRPNTVKQEPSKVIFGERALRGKITELETVILQERQKIQRLSQELKSAEQSLESKEQRYKATLQTIKVKIDEYKECQQMVINERNRNEQFKARVESLSSGFKQSLEFVISVLSNICLLPEKLKVNQSNKQLLDFSFEKQRSMTVPKNIFLQNKIIQFIELNIRSIEEFNLVEHINSIMKDYETKKQKITAQGGTVDLLQDSFMMDELKNISMGLISNSKDTNLESSQLLNQSGIADLQNQSNYNININLVLNDTVSESEKKRNAKLLELGKDETSFGQGISFGGSWAGENRANYSSGKNNAMNINNKAMDVSNQKNYPYYTTMDQMNQVNRSRSISSVPQLRPGLVGLKKNSHQFNQVGQSSSTFQKELGLEDLSQDVLSDNNDSFYQGGHYNGANQSLYQGVSGINSLLNTSANPHIKLDDESVDFSLSKNYSFEGGIPVSDKKQPNPHAYPIINARGYGNNSSSKKNENTSAEKTHQVLAQELLQKKADTEEPFVVEAMYTFSPERENDIGFNPGDKIRVMKTGKSGWWIGVNLSNRGNTKVGYFPKNFVSAILE